MSKLVGFTSRLSKESTYSNPASLPMSSSKLPQYCCVLQLNATPGLWHHKWHPIIFTLIVKDFSIKYFGNQHAHHLQTILKQHCKITQNWKGNQYTGINHTWDYSKCMHHLTIDEDICTLLLKYKHPLPHKCQLISYKATPIVDGANTQFTKDADNSSLLNDAGVK